LAEKLYKLREDRCKIGTDSTECEVWEMARLTASELREDLANVINKVAYTGEKIVVQRNGKDMAALVSIEDLELLQELEDQYDLETIRRAKEEPGENVPWEGVKKKLLKRLE
jgi:antitoxin Phd